MKVHRAPILVPAAAPSAAALKEPAKPDYGAQFVLLDLTRSPAHQVRQKAVSSMLQAPGTKAHPRQPDISESHISLMTLASPPLPADQAHHESATLPILAGFGALSGLTAARLAVEPQVSYLNAPRVGPPAFTVAYLKVSDPHGDLAKMRSAFAEASGLESDSQAPMHLTLGNLALGSRLTPETEDAIAQHAHQLGSWDQSDLLLSGRHGRVIAQTILG